MHLPEFDACSMYLALLASGIKCIKILLEKVNTGFCSF